MTSFDPESLHTTGPHVTQDLITRTVAANIRRLRTERGLNGDRFSELMTEEGARISRTTLGQLEVGKRAHVTVAELLAAARVLQVPTNALLGKEAACATCGGRPFAGFLCQSCGAAATDGTTPEQEQEP